MGFTELINEDIKKAMLAKEKEKYQRYTERTDHFRVHTEFDD